MSKISRDVIFSEKKAPAGRSTTSPRAWFHYLPLHSTICRCLPLFAVPHSVICRYLSLILVNCHDLPLIMTTGSSP